MAAMEPCGTQYLLPETMEAELTRLRAENEKLREILHRLVVNTIGCYRAMAPEENYLDVKSGKVGNRSADQSKPIQEALAALED